MRRFRVFDQIDYKMLYEGFALTNNGKLLQMNSDGSYSSAEENRYVIMFSTERTSYQNQEIYAEDYIRYYTGYEFTVHYGIHKQFCPGDNTIEMNVGFYAVDEEELEYPLSNIEAYVECVFGNTFEGLDEILRKDAYE